MCKITFEPVGTQDGKLSTHYVIEISVQKGLEDELYFVPSGEYLFFIHLICLPFGLIFSSLLSFRAYLKRDGTKMEIKPLDVWKLVKRKLSTKQAVCLPFLSSQLFQADYLFIPFKEIENLRNQLSPVAQPLKSLDSYDDQELEKIFQERERFYTTHRKFSKKHLSCLSLFSLFTQH